MNSRPVHDGTAHPIMFLNFSFRRYDLGTLYESCKNQVSDALDAYKRALELDPKNTTIIQRIEILNEQKRKGSAAPTLPPPPPQQPSPQDTNSMSFAGAQLSSNNPSTDTGLSSNSQASQYGIRHVRN